MLLNTNKIGVATTRAIAMTINVQLLILKRRTILLIGKKANFRSLITITIEFYQRSEQAAKIVSVKVRIAHRELTECDRQLQYLTRYIKV